MKRIVFLGFLALAPSGCLTTGLGDAVIWAVAIGGVPSAGPESNPSALDVGPESNPSVLVCNSATVTDPTTQCHSE